MLAAGTAVGEMWCTRKVPSLQCRSGFRFIFEDCKDPGTVLVVLSGYHLGNGEWLWVLIYLDAMLAAVMILQETKPVSAREHVLYPSSVDIIFALIPILVGTSMALSGHNIFHPSGNPTPSRSLHCLFLVPLSSEAQKPAKLIVVKLSGRQGTIALNDNCRGEWRT